MDDCIYYNALIDSPANENLVTYSILYNEKCICINQTSQKPKEMKLTILSLIEKSIVARYSQHKDNLFS